MGSRRADDGPTHPGLQRVVSLMRETFPDCPFRVLSIDSTAAGAERRVGDEAAAAEPAPKERGLRSSVEKSRDSSGLQQRGLSHRKLPSDQHRCDAAGAARRWPRRGSRPRNGCWSAPRGGADAHCAGLLVSSMPHGIEHEKASIRLITGQRGLLPSRRSVTASPPKTPPGPSSQSPRTWSRRKSSGLQYSSLPEALAERFHSSPAFLQQFGNPGVTHPRRTLKSRCRTSSRWSFRHPSPPRTKKARRPQALPALKGNRRPECAAPARPQPAVAPPKPDVVVTVTKGASALTVTDASGRVVFYAPVTTGSEHDPLPIGEWKVNGVQSNPSFRVQPGPVLGCRPDAHEGHDSIGAEQSRWRRVD